MTKSWVDCCAKFRRQREMRREGEKGGGLMTKTNVPLGDAFNGFMCCIQVYPTMTNAFSEN